ncbi:MAG: FMN-binding protein [Gemmatimonadetes bacterium]|nr:FMN-binding protein [Gemmatimonadota bacterium]
MTHSHGAAPTTELPDAGTPSWRLLATLGGSGALAGLLLVLAWQWTTPSITAHRAQVEQAAVAEVLKAPARMDTLYVVDGKLTRTPVGDPAKLERLVEGFDAQGKRSGVAGRAGEPGFADVVSVMIGFDPADGSLLGMKILGQKETPGLGDKIEKDSAFVGQFTGAKAPLTGVKARSGDNKSQVVTITGATISSRTVIRIINNAVARWQPMLAAYDREAKP